MCHHCPHQRHNTHLALGLGPLAVQDRRRLLFIWHICHHCPHQRHKSHLVLGLGPLSVQQRRHGSLIKELLITVSSIAATSRTSRSAWGRLPCSNAALWPCSASSRPRNCTVFTCRADHRQRQARDKPQQAAAGWDASRREASRDQPNAGAAPGAASSPPAGKATIVKRLDSGQLDAYQQTGIWLRTCQQQPHAQEARRPAQRCSLHRAGMTSDPPPACVSKHAWREVLHRATLYEGLCCITPPWWQGNEGLYCIMMPPCWRR